MVNCSAPGPDTSLDATYGALASPVRRAMLQRLGAGETRVTDLAEPLPMSLAAVSRHVRLLEQAGLVRRRVEGRVHWLALDPGPFDAAEDWMNRVRAFWMERLAALDTLLVDEGKHA